MMATVVRRTLALAATAVWLGACTTARCPTQQPSTVRFAGSGETAILQVEVARTPASWALGLTGTRFLPQDRGMLFRFPGPVSVPFWMKDTRLPLSIAFYGQDGRVVDVRDMEPCRQDPCPLYRSARPFVGAIEANRGYFLRHGIGVGDRVRVRTATCS
jgi:uncharacterized membrane protein (UPF0127 family)